MSKAALFRTVGDAFVTVSDTDASRSYDAYCAGCGWTRTSAEATRFAGGTMGRPTEPLAALKVDANRHALGCAEVPAAMWPGEEVL